MRTDAKAAAGLMTTFPARPPSSDQNAVRLRDNQRRHRARVKSHIAELEARLAETKAQLNAALDKINYLTTEVESLRRGQATERHTNPGPRYPSAPESRAHSRLQAVLPSSGDYANQSSCSLGEPTILNIAGPSVLERASLGEPGDPGALPAVRGSSTATATHLPTVLSPPSQDEQPHPQCSGNCNRPNQPHTQLEMAVVVLSDRYCKGLPAPHSGESTTTCVDAYGVIEQQNFSGMDVAAITSWLKPGFRGPTEQGGGCRVDTQLLFALLDNISSSKDL